MKRMLSTYISTMRASVRPIWRIRAGRYWEVDALRGVAFVLMAIYHVVWDLQGLGNFDIEVYTGFWHYEQQVTANMFIGLAGVSLALRYHRMTAKGSVSYAPYFRRGVTVFSWGVVIGIATFLFEPAYYVRFGILHLIGASILLAYPFLRFRWLNLFLGVFLLFLGRVVLWVGLNINWLDWVGLDATPRSAFDYFPLIPWFGVILIGIFLGNLLYGPEGRRFSIPDLSNLPGIPLLRLMGQNALLLYLIHQPIIIIALTMLGLIRPF